MNNQNYQSPYREINFELESQKEKVRQTPEHLENFLNEKFQYKEIKIDWESFKLLGDPEKIEIPFSQWHLSQGMFPDSKTVPTRKYTFVGKVISPLEHKNKDIPFLIKRVFPSFQRVFDLRVEGDNFFFSITVQRFTEDDESVRLVKRGKADAIEFLKQQLAMCNQSFLDFNSKVSEFISSRIKQIIDEGNKMDIFKKKIDL